MLYLRTFYLWVPLHLGHTDTEDMDLLAPLIIEDIYATVRESAKLSSTTLRGGGVTSFLIDTSSLRKRERDLHITSRTW